MKINLHTRNHWFDICAEGKPELDVSESPYSNNYFLFSESVAIPMNEISSNHKQFHYQAISSNCIWISMPEPYTHASTGREEIDWELCKGTNFKPVKPKLITFDMDSTLIAEEVIDEIARDAGCYQQVASVTDQAMQGELDFNQSLIKRVSLIKGLSVHRLDIIAARLNLSEGAESLLNCLHQQNINTAILSGGFDFFASIISAKLGIETVYSNQLEVKNNLLSGEVVAPIVNAEMKAFYLEKIAKEHGCDLSETMAVGDGANDLPVLSASGLGIAWHAKPAVAEQADVAINYLGLNVISWLWE